MILIKKEYFKKYLMRLLKNFHDFFFLICLMYIPTNAMIIITRMIIVILLNVRTPEVPLVEKNGVEIWNVK